jgi:proline dehydrogenase
MSVMKKLLLWSSTNAWMKEHLPRFQFVKRAVTRFMPGETLESALDAAHILKAGGFSSILTYLGENVSSIDEAMAVRDHYVTVLDALHREGLPTEISIKLTQLGLDIEPAKARDMLRDLLIAGRRTNSFVWIDIESSPYVDRTLELYRLVRKEFSNVGLCLQSYLYRTGDDLTTLLPLGPSIRLVKGAYREPDSIAYPRKYDVDRNYISLAERLLTELPQTSSRIGIATHDGAIVETVKAFALAHGIAPEQFEFQMLYGIGRDTQRDLLVKGYRVRVLVSYGAAWFPWYMRRLAERPANVWFVLKSVVVR